ncbi:MULTISPECIES: class II aldolase [Olsenella]|uniref:class II aldolase n=1 Tax=Olsenella TaxID=133925 RepID=UPI00071CBE20|nr:MULTISPECIES: class II aldolase [Olsenella]OFK22425.1 fructose-1,6-bisphosphate aldolase [Olsenella sp. HMSC062G07]
MALVDMNELVTIAKKNDVLLPAFNTTNLEMTLAIMDAFERAGMPGIIQIAPTNVRLSGYEYISTIVHMADKSYSVPFALHLDHGKTIDDVRNAVNAGFTSVMIDGAALPFEENILFSRRAVDYCHCKGVPVEAELGAIKGKEDDHVSEADLKTDPSQVKEFVEGSGCDLLAVSVGNVHGLEDTPKIDLPLLEKISAVSPCPLVLHGGSGIEYSTIFAMKKYNMVKINIASDLRRAFISSVGKAYEANAMEHNLAKVLLEARSAVTEVAYKTLLAINGME